MIHRLFFAFIGQFFLREENWPDSDLKWVLKGVSEGEVDVDVPAVGCAQFQADGAGNLGVGVESQAQAVDPIFEGEGTRDSVEQSQVVEEGEGDVLRVAEEESLEGFAKCRAHDQPVCGANLFSCQARKSGGRELE